MKQFKDIFFILLIFTSVQKVFSEENRGVELLYAAKYGNLPQAKRLLESGVDIHFRNKEYFNSASALYLASQEGHFDIVSFLLSKGAKPDFGTEYGYTPLGIAKTVEIAALLFKNGADPNYQENGRQTPLMVATENLNENVVQFLIKKNADASKVTGGNRTALIILLWRKKKNEDQIQAIINIAKLLIPISPLDIQANSDHQTALMLSLVYGYIEVAYLLIDANANLDLRSKKTKWTALAIAARRKELAIKKALVEAGANLDFRYNRYKGYDSDNNRTLLYEALVGKKPYHIEFAKLLIRHGANYNLKSGPREDQHVFDKIVPHPSVIIVLLKKGMNPNWSNGKLIHSAASKDNSSLEYLLEAGGDPNLENEKGENAFFYAYHARNVELLASYGGNINHVRTGGDWPTTPLMQMLWLSSPIRIPDLTALVNEFIKQGTDVNISPKQNAAAICLIGSKKIEIVSAILKAGANVNFLCYEQSTLLVLQVRFYDVTRDKELSLNIMKQLLDYGAKKNLKNSYGKSAIDYAKEDGYQEVLDLLGIKGFL